MKTTRKFHAILFIVIMSFMVVQGGYAQGTAGSDKDASVHSLYSGLGYSNNMIYMGSNLSQDKPLYTGSLTYGYKDQLFATVSVNHLAAYDPVISFSAFTLSYSRDLNNWFDVSLDLSRYQVNSELSDTLFNNFFYGSIALGADWKILYTNLSIGGVFSEGSGAYFQLRNSRYFETSRIMNNRIFFSFDPFVNLLAGTLTKTVTPDGTIIGVSEPFKSSKSGSGQHSSSSSTDYFSLMEIDFGLPVGINSDRVTIEAEPGYIMPAYSGSEAEGTEGFTFFLSIYFTIFK